MLRKVFWLAALLVATPVAAQDGVNLSETTRYWDVYGSSIGAISRDLQDPPADLHGYQGYTSFEFAWRYDYEMRGGVCDVYNARVEIDIVIWLPRHAQYAELDRNVRRTWDRFIAALTRHEENHARDFRETGVKIPEALNAVEAPSCRDIQRIVGARAMEFVQEAQHLADLYDRRTNHGLSEGTHFPDR